MCVIPPPDSSVLNNAQPFIINHAGHTLCVGHNGNLVNASQLRRRLEMEGSIFQTSMDSEIVMHLLARNIHMGFEDALLEALQHLRGALLLPVHDRRHAGGRP